MKTISKKKLDALIDMTREYWVTGDREILSKRIELARSVETEIGLNWGAPLNLLDGILECSGFLPDAENDEIHSVLRFLGWRVKDEVQEIESL